MSEEYFKQKGGKMRSITILFACCLALSVCNSQPSVNDESIQQVKTAMKDMMLIATVITDHITDNGISPPNSGTFHENSAFYKALSPLYISTLPIKDPWGHEFRVYCGDACNGKYGVSAEDAMDFLIVSYGKDGLEEAWQYDELDEEAGLYYISSDEDLKKDFVLWNGTLVRGPKGDY